MKLLIINGPNLNLLGQREKGIYGEQTFESYLDELKKRFPDITLDYYQSNIEGELVDKLHTACNIRNMSMVHDDPQSCATAGSSPGKRLS